MAVGLQETHNIFSELMYVENTCHAISVNTNVIITCSLSLISSFFAKMTLPNIKNLVCFLFKKKLRVAEVFSCSVKKKLKSVENVLSVISPRKEVFTNGCL